MIAENATNGLRLDSMSLASLDVAQPAARRQALLLLQVSNRLPYNLYCVGGDVKHCTIQSNLLQYTDRQARVTADKERVLHVGYTEQR